MPFTRKEFLKLSLKSAFMIGLGNSLQSFASEDFKLPDRDSVRLRFAVASDGHFGQPGTSYEFYHDRMVAFLNQEKAGRGIEFAVINGDLFHNDEHYLPEAKKLWDQLQMPYYVSHGNHDQTGEKNWENTWGTPQNYSFEMGDAAFVVLNTANEYGVYTCADSGWARKELRKYESRPFLFVFMHITPYKWTQGGINCPEIADLFDHQANLKAIFHGHDHDQDDVKMSHGKHYFFDSHIAGSWGTDYHGYRIVEILDDGNVLTYQMNPGSGMKVNNKSIK
jgi:3',5'-cyclic-AMP phosphodiesterase